MLPIIKTDFVKAGFGIHGAENLVGADHGRRVAVKGSFPIGFVPIQQDDVSGTRELCPEGNGIGVAMHDFHLARGLAIFHRQGHAMACPDLW